MKKSESIKELATAFAKAQGSMKPAEFDSVNPHFRNKYASLASIIACSRDALAANGLSVVQCLRSEGNVETVVTTILHSSGEWIEDDGVRLILDKPNMQGLGSATTYAKRYGLSSMLRIVAEEDDDAESAVGRGPALAKEQPPVKNISGVITSAPLKHETKAEEPWCKDCDSKMLVSKFNQEEIYCPKCKKKAPRHAA